MRRRRIGGAQALRGRTRTRRGSPIGNEDRGGGRTRSVRETGDREGTAPCHPPRPWRQSHPQHRRWMRPSRKAFRKASGCQSRPNRLAESNRRSTTDVPGAPKSRGPASHQQNHQDRKEEGVGRVHGFGRVLPDHVRCGIAPSLPGNFRCAVFPKLGRRLRIVAPVRVQRITVPCDSSQAASGFPGLGVWVGSLFPVARGVVRGSFIGWISTWPSAKASVGPF